MVGRECPNCKHVFHRKSSYDDHLKTDCKNKPRFFRTKEYKCGICDMIFNRSDVLATHMKNCQKKEDDRLPPIAENTGENNINNYTNNNGNINGNNNANIVNHTVRNDIHNVIVNGPLNIININILVPYTQNFDLSQMEKEELNNIFNSGKNPFVVYFELVHCNPDRPMYHNLCYVDDRTIRVFTQEGWTDKCWNNIMSTVITKEESSMSNYLSNMHLFMDDNEFDNVSRAITSVQVPRKNCRQEIGVKTITYVAQTKLQMLQSLKHHKLIYFPTVDKISKICLTPQFQKNKSSHMRQKTIQKIKEHIDFENKSKENRNNESDSSSGSDSSSKSDELLIYTRKKTKKDKGTFSDSNKREIEGSCGESYDDVTFDESYDDVMFDKSYDDVTFDESYDNDDEIYKSTNKKFIELSKRKPVSKYIISKQ
jgi:hypothetical protein